MIGWMFKRKNIRMLWQSFLKLLQLVVQYGRYNVGAVVGSFVGAHEGVNVGAIVGSFVGAHEGVNVGAYEGLHVVASIGVDVGAGEDEVIIRILSLPSSP